MLNFNEKRATIFFIRIHSEEKCTAHLLIQLLGKIDCWHIKSIMTFIKFALYLSETYHNLRHFGQVISGCMIHLWLSLHVWVDHKCFTIAFQCKCPNFWRIAWESIDVLIANSAALKIIPNEFLFNYVIATSCLWTFFSTSTKSVMIQSSFFFAAV